MKQFLESQNFLQTIAGEAEKNSEIARQLFSDLSEAQLNWKPAPEKWSIAQCLEHLAVATNKFRPYFSGAIASAKKTNSHPVYHPSLMGGWLIKYVSPESPRKLRAPKIFRPGDASNVRGSLASFLEEQEHFVQFVRKAEGIDYNKSRLRSPVTPLMRYSLADAFVITVVHAQRHLAQARRVREMPGFPN
jgi:hypothetical protein